MSSSCSSLSRTPGREEKHPFWRQLASGLKKRFFHTPYRTGSRIRGWLLMTMILSYLPPSGEVLHFVR